MADGHKWEAVMDEVSVGWVVRGWRCRKCLCLTSVGSRPGRDYPVWAAATATAQATPMSCEEFVAREVLDS